MNAITKVLLLIAVVFTAPSLGMAKSDFSEAEKFVTDVGNEIVGVFADKSSPRQDRKERFRKILIQHFNIQSIGKFVLRRHWATATDPQREEFLKLFETALVENYSTHFDNYKNEKLKVSGARASGADGIIVQSDIIRPQGGEPLHVDWKIYPVEGRLMAFDLVVNGVSMSQSQRTEYGTLIQNNGGTLEGLLATLRAKYK